MTAVAEPAVVADRDSSPPTPAAAVGFRAVVERGLRDRWRSVLSWGLSLGAMGAFIAAIYPSIQGALDKLVKSYPAGLKQAFEAQDLSTVEGYLNAEMFSLVIPLALGYFMIRAIAGATVAAEERGYLDTILALPLTRAALMLGSYVVAAIVSLAIMLLTGVLTFVVGRIAGTHISLGLVSAGVIGVWPLGLFFGAVAALAAGALHTVRAVDGIGVGALVGMYAIDLAGRLDPSIGGIRWVSAFRYYGSPMRDGIDPAAFFGLIGASLVLVIAGAYLFERRDVSR